MERKIRFIQALFVIFLVMLSVIIWDYHLGAGIWAIYLCLVLLLAWQFWQIYLPVVKAERILDKIGEKPEVSSHYENLSNLELDEKIQKLFEYLQETVNREYRTQVLKKQAELNELQSQINPHFLYNTLESIRGEALGEGLEEIADMTEALGYFFRYSISRKKNLVTLQEELKNIQNYYLIQKFRFGSRIDMKIEIEEEDKIIGFMMPKLLIQPIVENAIFHGLEKKMGKGTISISIACTDQRLVLVISDDGMGMTEESLEKLNKKLEKGVDFTDSQDDYKNAGIALDNVNQRIKLSFGSEYGLHVYSTQNIGTDVVITLPVLDKAMEDESRKGERYES